MNHSSIGSDAVDCLGLRQSVVAGFCVLWASIAAGNGSELLLSM